MNSTDLMICVASWEERFLLGFQRLVDERSPGSVCVFWYREYGKRTRDKRKAVIDICEQRSITSVHQSLSFEDPAGSWTSVVANLGPLLAQADSVVVDITTMPREVIYSVFDILVAANKDCEYAYHKPRSYNSQWLSRDPGKPRLVYRLGGVVRLGLPTVLIIVAGYDTERVRQLIRHFEPEHTYLGIQAGDQFDNRKYMESYRQEFENEPDVELFELDSFADDHGLSTLEKWVLARSNDYNVIMSSLGPKLSAVALFRLHRKHEATALAYAPSNEFSLDYSQGITDSVFGRL